jgi:hypothetical protein
VRIDEARCPFCHADVVAPREPVRVPLGRIGRAALFAFGATLGATSVGCGDSHVPPTDGGPMADAGFDAGGPGPLYGPAPYDAGTSPQDSGGAMTLYGGAPGD